MSARNDHHNDHPVEPIGHSDPEAAAKLSDALRQMIVDVHNYDTTLTAEQIIVALQGQTNEELTPGAVNSVLLAAAEPSVE